MIAALDKKPVVMGHSTGGLLTFMIAGRGIAAASVPIDPGPFRGVLPLPPAALKSAAPVLTKPWTRGRAVTLTQEQFDYGWGNNLSKEESKQLYEQYHVAAPAVALMQMANANLNPLTEAKADSKNPERGPMLVISGEKDHAVPPAIAHAAYKRQARNPGSDRVRVDPKPGDSLTIDTGWLEVARPRWTSSRRTGCREARQLRAKQVVACRVRRPARHRPRRAGRCPPSGAAAARGQWCSAAETPRMRRASSMAPPGRGLRQQQDELVAPPAEAEVGLRDLRGDDPGDRLQYLVALVAALVLVDRLEVVHVHHQQAQGGAAAAGPRDLAAAASSKGESAAEPCELGSRAVRPIVHLGRIGGPGETSIPVNDERRPGLDARFSPC